MQAVSEVLVSTLPPSHLFLELSMVLSLPSSLESEEMPTWMAKQAPGVLSMVFPKGGVGWENSSLSAPGNKVSRLKERLSCQSLAGAPLQPFNLPQQAGNPNVRRGPPKPITSRSHCLGSSFEARHVPLPLPAKPQSSTLCLDWTVGEVQQEGVALPRREGVRVWGGAGGDPSHSTGTAGGRFQWGAGQGQV